MTIKAQSDCQLTADGVRFRVKREVPNWVTVTAHWDACRRAVIVRLRGPWWRKRLLGVTGQAKWLTRARLVVEGDLPPNVVLEVMWW